MKKRAVRFGLVLDDEVLKKRAERFGDQLGNNENLHLDEKKKNFRKRKLNRALGRLGNKRVLSNKNKFSNRRRSFRNRRFEGRNGNSNSLRRTKTRGGLRLRGGRRGSIRRSRGGF